MFPPQFLAAPMFGQQMLGVGGGGGYPFLGFQDMDMDQLPQQLFAYQMGFMTGTEFVNLVHRANRRRGHHRHFQLHHGAGVDPQVLWLLMNGGMGGGMGMGMGGIGGLPGMVGGHHLLMPHHGHRQYL